LSTGALTPHIARRVPLQDAAKALAEHARGGFTGKLVLVKP